MPTDTTQLQVDIANDLPEVSFFSNEIGRELLTNAARHSCGSLVHLTFTRDGRDEVLGVTDDGVGMG